MADGPGAAEGRTIDVLRRQLAEARAERDQVQAQQAALAEVLQLINRSPDDLTPVFGAIIEKAMTLCDAAFGALLGYGNDQLTMLAHRNGPPAIPGVQPETVALLRFEDRAALDRWLGAPERHAALDQMARLVDGERTITVLGGFGGWFSTSAGTEPRRWKQAVVVLTALIPVALAVSVARQVVLPGLPLVPAVVATAVANVSVLTWIAMPTLTRRLGGWLSR